MCTSGSKNDSDEKSIVTRIQIVGRVLKYEIYTGVGIFEWLCNGTRSPVTRGLTHLFSREDYTTDRSILREDIKDMSTTLIAHNPFTMSILLIISPLTSFSLIPKSLGLP